jgi:two-component system sensor histidine kinase ChiS
MDDKSRICNDQLKGDFIGGNDNEEVDFIDSNDDEKDDLIEFTDEDKEDYIDVSEDSLSLKSKSKREWKILIVDDEKEVHEVTRLALQDTSFEGKPLGFLSAYSGKQAIEMVKMHPDIALILLDVIMENDHSGLQVVEYIRAKLKNRFVQIVIRTGQPGNAPEDIISIKYDINNYKSKTELTRQKLTNTIIQNLRGYKYLKELEDEKVAAERRYKQLAKANTTRSNEFSQTIENWEVNTKEQSETISNIVEKESFITLKHKLARLKKLNLGRR